MADIYVSLDILFLDADKEIYRIRKNAPPLSKISIPSGGKAMYVLQEAQGRKFLWFGKIWMNCWLVVTDDPKINN